MSVKDSMGLVILLYKALHLLNNTLDWFGYFVLICHDRPMCELRGFHESCNGVRVRVARSY